jgi:hypothetical protein
MRLQELNQWNTIYNWGNWLTRGRPRVRKFEKPVTFTIREDFKVTAGFLGCGEDFLEAVDKEFEIEKQKEVGRLQKFGKYKQNSDWVSVILFAKCLLHAREGNVQHRTHYRATKKSLRSLLLFPNRFSTSKSAKLAER